MNTCGAGRVRECSASQYSVGLVLVVEGDQRAGGCGNILAIIKRINPAMLGSSHRNALYGAAKQTLGIV
jgi:hypothetical protein